MENQPTILSVDLGASSGRVLGFQIQATGAMPSMQMIEVHRFPNYGIRIGDHLMWNLPGLWREVTTGITAAAANFGSSQIQSIGVDTWGVDFGLLSPSMELLGLPFHYRDSQNDGMLEEAFEIVPREKIYDRTGLQLMNINSLYQLLAIKKRRPALLDAAEHFLMIPDLFHWLLTGEISHEKTDSSTSQLYDPNSQSWSDELINDFGLKRSMFGSISEPGTSLGSLRASLLAETGVAKATKVILPGSHDTASAVLAVPVQQSTDAVDWCYISSGTWSLMGIETKQPIINQDTSRWNFTNEAGVYGTNRILKNIAGLWLVQECQRIWKREGFDYGWQKLVQMASSVPEGNCIIEPDDASLVAPVDMPKAICQLAAVNGTTLRSHAEIIRCAVDSLAVRYAVVFKMLEELAGNRIETIHVVGGGAKNELLCQLTANACQRRVLAGPVEATAIGNALVQAITLGILADSCAARALVRQMEKPIEFLPQPSCLPEKAS